MLQDRTQFLFMNYNLNFGWTKESDDTAYASPVKDSYFCFKIMGVSLILEALMHVFMSYLSCLTWQDLFTLD